MVPVKAKIARQAIRVHLDTVHCSYFLLYGGFDFTCGEVSCGSGMVVTLADRQEMNFLSRILHSPFRISTSVLFSSAVCPKTGDIDRCVLLLSDHVGLQGGLAALRGDRVGLPEGVAALHGDFAAVMGDEAALLPARVGLAEGLAVLQGDGVGLHAGLAALHRILVGL
jgi:hypothetical protein